MKFNSSGTAAGASDVAAGCPGTAVPTTWSGAVELDTSGTGAGDVAAAGEPAWASTVDSLEDPHEARSEIDATKPRPHMTRRFLIATGSHTQATDDLHEGKSFAIVSIFPDGTRQLESTAETDIACEQ